MKARELTHETLITRVNYNPTTGIFSQIKHKGRVSGTLDKDGYLKVSVLRTKHLAHRLAWLYMTGFHAPEHMHVDHINGVRSDNRWENLRLATPLENQAYRVALNTNKPGIGTSGIRGVYWDGRTNKWHVQIRRNGRIHYGGYHFTLDLAEAAAKSLRSRLPAISHSA